MKVALVYDRVNKFGGAERVLLALHELWPEAPLYTSVYNKQLAPWADVFKVRTSFLQNLPLPKNRHELYPFFMGLAFETFNFDENDVVISVTSEFSKALITKPNVLHICYCLTPTNYLWSGRQAYFSSKPEWFKTLSRPVVDYLRFYDKVIAHRPDLYIAISKTVQERIKKYYDIESKVIYPPVSALEKNDSFKVVKDFYLVVSRLVPNKRVDIAVKAFNKLGWPLKIVGKGIEESRLRSLAKNNIEFLSDLTDEKLAVYYRSCRAVIVCGDEDFNIVAIEAQGYGKPVIAYQSGGVTETIIAGKTGFFFSEHNTDSLIEVLKTSDVGKINPKDCIQNSQQFLKVRFKNEFKNFVQESWEAYVR